MGIQNVGDVGMLLILDSRSCSGSKGIHLKTVITTMMMRVICDLRLFWAFLTSLEPILKEFYAIWKIFSPAIVIFCFYVELSIFTSLAFFP